MNLDDIIWKEVDEPFDQTADTKDVSEAVPKNDVKKMERLLSLKKSLQDIEIKDFAMKIVILSLVILGVIYIIESALSFWGKSSSSLAAQIADTLKSVTTLGLGFLFAIKVNDK